MTNCFHLSINSNWSGENYSGRIWNNTRRLADRVKQEMLLEFITGKRQEEAAREIAKTFQTGASNARRLIRTESNYVNGQMQLAAYEECGADMYEFVAVLDLRTSEICQSLDGKKFKVSEAKVGVNMNPMHPYCRSTTVISLEDDDLDNLQRRARDPETGKNKKVPASTNYMEWYNKNVGKREEAADIAKSIAKSVAVPDDCEYTRSVNNNFKNKNIEEDVIRAIDRAISRRLEAEKDFEFNDILVGKFSSNDKSVFITNGEFKGYDIKNTLYLNSEMLEGKTLDEINKMCEINYNSNWWKSQSLEDLVNHEIMHARINSLCGSYEKTEGLYDMLKIDKRVKGFCRFVDEYPDEFLNEMYVSILKGEHIEEKYVKVYNEYIARYLRG